MAHRRSGRTSDFCEESQSFSVFTSSIRNTCRPVRDPQRIYFFHWESEHCYHTGTSPPSLLQWALSIMQRKKNAIGSLRIPLIKSKCTYKNLRNCQIREPPKEAPAPPYQKKNPPSNGKPQPKQDRLGIRPSTNCVSSTVNQMDCQKKFHLNHSLTRHLKKARPWTLGNSTASHWLCATSVAYRCSKSAGTDTWEHTKHLPKVSRGGGVKRPLTSHQVISFSVRVPSANIQYVATNYYIALTLAPAPDPPPEQPQERPLEEVEILKKYIPLSLVLPHCKEDITVGHRHFQHNIQTTIRICGMRQHGDYNNSQPGHVLKNNQDSLC